MPGINDNGERMIRLCRTRVGGWKHFYNKDINK